MRAASAPRGRGRRQVRFGAVRTGATAAGAAAAAARGVTAAARAVPAAVRAAAVLLSLVAALTFAAPASAQRAVGELRVEPERPGRGAALAFTYQPGPPELAVEPKLHVRARLRTAAMDDRRDGIVLDFAVLERDEAGVFRGSGALPDSVVYAAFVVERPDGGAVDGRGGRFLAVTVHDGAGRPTYAGLVQRAHDHLTRDYRTVLETGHALVEHYPERPFSWMVRISAEEWVHGAASTPVIAELMEAAYPALFEAVLAKPDSPPDDLETLMFLANALDQDDAAELLYERLQARWPASPIGVRIRLGALATRLDGRPAELLDSLEAAWQAGEHGDELAGWGMTAARRAGDERRQLVWTRRYAEASGDRFFGVHRLARSPEHRAAALGPLREHIGLLASGTYRRAFGRTVAEQREANATSLARSLVALGEVLIDEGKPAAGLDTLKAATEALFWPWPARAYGDALFAAGDTAGALRQWARVANGPGVSAAYRDTVRLRAGAHFDAAGWDALVAVARAHMIERIAGSALDRPLPGRLRVEDGEGAQRALRDVVGGKPTLVVVWSRGCEPSLRAMPAVHALAEAGVRVVALTLDPRAPDDAAFRAERGITLPVYHDVRAEATAFLRATGTPQYFLIDERGVLRFAFTEPDAVPLQLEAMRGGSGSGSGPGSGAVAGGRGTGRAR